MKRWLALVFVSCLAPTQVSVDISTNFDCIARKTTTNVFVGDETTFGTSTSPRANKDTCKSAKEVGSLVLVPSNMGDKVYVRIVAGLDGTRPENCANGTCIEAKRIVRFVSHASLHLPIVLDAKCANKICDITQTCIEGGCVDVTRIPIDCNQLSCVTPQPQTCAMGTTSCNGTCVDLAIDDQNCGACGNACASGEACVQGACVRGLGRVEGGLGHTCAITKIGVLRCWGRNDLGQLGNGTTTMSTLPVTPNLPNVDAVDLGAFHSCALASGKIYCWGRNFSGQLATGKNQDVAIPSPIVQTDSNATPFVAGQVSAGGETSCARIVPSSLLACWGYNQDGQIGDGTIQNKTTPFLVQNGAFQAEAVSVGYMHTCAVHTGNVFCWGKDATGQLGDGMTNGGSRTIPTQVPNVLPPMAQVIAGQTHTCAITQTGTAMCWGSNTTGQLGDGKMTVVEGPMPVSNLQDVIAMALGSSHTCALTKTRDVFCWGSNVYGQLGDGSMAPQLTPKKILSNAIAIGAGELHTCAFMFDGTMRCWGYNFYGQLGDGTNMNRTSPTPVMNF